MIIRLADVKNETEQILAGMRNFISRMDYTEIFPIDAGWYKEYIIELLSKPEIEVTVADDDGELVAGIGMAFSPVLWNPTMIQAEEIFWWASPNAPPTAAIRVIKAAMASVKSDTDTMIVFKSMTSSPDSVGRIYGRLGLREVETCYVGVV